MLLLEIGLKSLCATVVLLQIGPYCSEGKACVKHRAQLSWFLKLVSKHSVQLTFCLKLATFVKNLKFVKNTVRNSAVAWNWLFDIKRVGNWSENAMRNFGFA